MNPTLKSLEARVHGLVWRVPYALVPTIRDGYGNE